MPHIHTQPGQHDLVVSMYIVRTDFDQPKLILHWHKKLNRWMQYGGHVELDENPWQAVEHELLEETGYELSQLKILQRTDRLKSMNNINLHPQPLSVNTHVITNEHSHIGNDYVFVTNEEPLHAIGAGESDKLMLVTKEELLALRYPETDQWVKDVGTYIFDECLPNWEQVEAEVK